MDDLAPVIAEPPGEASASGGAEENLLLSPAMQVEQSDLQAATLYLSSTGTRIRVPRTLYELLLEFETPRSAASVAGVDSRAASAIGKFRDKGFLVAEGEAAKPAARRLVTDPPVRLFDCPAQKLTAGGADVAALGIPYDLSDPDAAGARLGPSALRQTSLQMLYGIDRRTGRPQGWFDADLGRPILDGVTIGDCGDVFVDPGERQGQLFGRISEVVAKATEGGSLPVLLGGDRAVGFPAIELLQADRPLAVIRIGGAAAAAAAPSSFVSPATLAARVLALPRVSRFVQIGGRGRADGALPGLRTISAAQLRSDGLAALDRHLGDAGRVYVGLDLSALAAPGDAPGDERFEYAELHSLLCGIGGRYAVAGMDLTGANPLKPGWGATAMTAVHLLLTALGAAKDRDGKEARP